MIRILTHKTTLVIFALMIVLMSLFVSTKKGTELYQAIPTINISQSKPTSTPSEIELPTKPLYNYFEIIDSCNSSYIGSCVNMRSGPGTNYKVVERLRTGMVLPVMEKITAENKIWYKVKIETAIGFPERITSDWYVASGDYVHLFKDTGPEQIKINEKATSSTKRIIVDLSEQTLYAYDGKNLFMKVLTSTGLKETPTPRGAYTIFRKTPSRYMQGPLPGVSEQVYDLPGVPWDLYFTEEGAVIHGAYWHDSFGKKWSHGCVNLSSENAKKLYFWADIGIPVIIQD